MSTAGIRAGRAFVEIGTDQTLFDRGIKAVRASMTRLAASASTIGRSFSSGFGAANGALKTMAGGLMNTRSLLVAMVGSAGVGMIVQQFADAGSALDDMSQRTGVAVEELSALGFAAKMSGTDIGAVEKAIRKMQQSGKVISLPATQTGDGPVPSDAMASLMHYADQIAAIQDPAKQTAMAIEIFGKSGASLLPMLKGGSDGIRKMNAEAARMGVVMSGTDAAAAAELGDGIDKLTIAMSALWNRIGSALAPLLIRLAEIITDVVVNVSAFVSENRELLMTLAKWGMLGAGLLAGLAAIGTAGLALSAMMTGLAAIGGAVATVFTLIGGALAFVLSPLGLVLAGVIGAAGAFVYFSGAGATAIQYISDQFSQLRDWIGPIIDGVTNALMSGQWAAAAKIAMLALEQAIRVGTQPIYNIWTDVYSFLATTTVSLMATIANTFASGWTSVVNGFANATTSLTNIFASIPGTLMQGFNTAITWLTGAWDSTVNYIAKKLLYLYSLFDKSVDYEAAAKQMDVDAAARADARQKQLDTANNKLQTETDKANANRLKSLDEATRKRDAALADANARRSEFATGVTQGIRDQANERKSAFDARIQQLGSEIATTLEGVNREAAARQAARDAAKQQDLEKPQFNLPDLTAPAMQSAMGEAQKAVGTFSGFGAGLAGGGGVNNSLQSMVKLQSNANKKLDEIAENTASDSDALEFGA